MQESVGTCGWPRSARVSDVPAQLSLGGVSLKMLKVFVGVGHRKAMTGRDLGAGLLVRVRITRELVSPQPPLRRGIIYLSVKSRSRNTVSNSAIPRL